ncbi:MAG: hypothetical protein JNN18_04680 [Rubrivivax sp.]|jgi:hypothetical protein|nr:hypothetical protein [Rubrivivax sp.]
MLVALTQGAQATEILPVFVEPGGGRDVEFHVLGQVGTGFPNFTLDVLRSAYTPTTAEVSGRCTTWGTIHCDFFEGKYALVLTQSGDVTSDFITVDWGGNRTINDDGSVSIDFSLAYYSRPFAEGFDQGLFDEFPIAQSMLRVPANHCEYIAVRPEVSCAFEEEFFFPFGLTSGIGIVDLAPIPLPATPALLGTALLGLTWIRRRR